MASKALRLVKQHLARVLPPHELASVRVLHGRKRTRIEVEAIKLVHPIPTNPADHRWFENWTHQFRQARQAALLRCHESVDKKKSKP